MKVRWVQLGRDRRWLIRVWDEREVKEYIVSCVVVFLIISTFVKPKHTSLGSSPIGVLKRSD
jgi:hypothetical protein